MSEPRTLTGGLVVGDSPRWQEGRVWFSDYTMAASEVMGRRPRER